jgi:hypothetical protein
VKTSGNFCRKLLDNRKVCGKNEAMNGGRVIFAVAAALTLGLAAGSAVGADATADPSAKVSVKTAPSQTASIEVTAPTRQPVLNLDVVPHRFDDLAPPQPLDLAGTEPPKAPAPTLGAQTGARFVPLIRKTDNADDPQNHGGFTDKHEFGIELKSNF